MDSKSFFRSQTQHEGSNGNRGTGSDGKVPSFALLQQNEIFLLFIGIFSLHEIIIISKKKKQFLFICALEIVIGSGLKDEK